MTRMRAAILVLALLLTAGFAVRASAGEDQTAMGGGCCGDMSAPAQKAETPAATPKAVTEVGNTICPITGEPVGSMQKGAHVDYKDQRVGLCCSGCVKKFLKNGDANLKKAQDQAAQAKKAAEGKKEK